MRSNGSSRASWARGFMALFAGLGLGLMARPAGAAPFAYVANSGDGTVSVIDTAKTPRPWWPRSRWGTAPMRSPSPRMDTPMSG